MYILFKNKRPAGNKKYATYDEARQAARKLIRKNDFWWNMGPRDSTNPTPLSLYGYEIRKTS